MREDDWKVSPLLTLNFGLRYELYWPLYEAQNGLSNFVTDPTNPNFGHMIFAGLNGQSRAHSSASNFCCGTVWKYSLSTGVLTTLVSFDGDSVPADGMFPMGGVTLDGQGNLYGTTEYGGAFGDGIVYEYSAAGVLSTLVTFSGPNGSNPEGNLVFDGAGNLHGITNQGGTSGYGTVFKLTPNTSGGTCSGLLRAITGSIRLVYAKTICGIFACIASKEKQLGRLGDAVTLGEFG